MSLPLTVTPPVAVGRHAPSRRRAEWPDILLPKEHGSWSLAFEPVALGLLAAPSPAGGLLSLAVGAAFFARRPLRIAMSDSDISRRRTALAMIVLLGLVAAAGLMAVLASRGARWMAWSAPTALFGAAFAWFDFRKVNRAASAELAGTLAFAWLPSVFAVLGGRPAVSAAALGLAMIIRAVPTVLTLRAVLRARKTGKWCGGPALAATAAALSLAVMLARAEIAPWMLAGFALLFAMRSCALLLLLRPALRARTLGIIEMSGGILFVGAVAWAWPG